MFHCHRLRAVFYNLSSTAECCYFLLLKPHHSLNSFFSTITCDSDKPSFTISYLTHNCGLSLQDALKVSKRLRFNTPDKPDSVIAFFKTHGFSTAQIQTIIRKNPDIIVSSPIKTILPKFQFLASKCASPQDIVVAVTRNPRFLRVSLDKYIIPAFDLVRTFCPSDHKAITSILLSCPAYMKKLNINFLLDFGVTRSSIYRLLTSRPSIICSTDFKKDLEEIKELGFDPSKYNFCVALLAKRAITKSQWDAKVDAFKSWGYSEDEILRAFKRQPNFMLRSPDKLNAVMRFWIEQLGWDPLVLLAAPDLFGFSLEKRFIPRASVVQYLLSKGLMKKSASLYAPFSLKDELFLKRYVNGFEEEASRLLRLYQGEDASICCLDKL